MRLKSNVSVTYLITPKYSLLCMKNLCRFLKNRFVESSSQLLFINIQTRSVEYGDSGGAM